MIDDCFECYNKKTKKYIPIEEGEKLIYNQLSEIKQWFFINGKGLVCQIENSLYVIKNAFIKEKYFEKEIEYDFIKRENMNNETQHDKNPSDFDDDEYDDIIVD